MNYSEALEIFNLSSLSDVTEEDFKALYRKLARAKHPDTNNGSSKDFVELKEAFDYLKTYGSFHSNKRGLKKIKQLVKTDLVTIDALSKDEVVKRYREDRKTLENQIEIYQQSFFAQENTMTEIKNVVQNIMNDYENEKSKLQLELDDQIYSLEHEYRPNFFKRILFFLPKMSSHEFWRKYNEFVSSYTSKNDSLNLSFFKIMVATYGEGLNKISQNLDK